MLRWSAIFLVIALIAGAMGMSGVAGTAAGIAEFLFGLFLVLFAVSLVIGLAAGRKVTKAVRHEKTSEPKHLVHR